MTRTAFTERRGYILSSITLLKQNLVELNAMRSSVARRMFLFNDSAQPSAAFGLLGMLRIQMEELTMHILQAEQDLASAEQCLQELYDRAAADTARLYGRQVQVIDLTQRTYHRRPEVQRLQEDMYW